MSMIQTFSFAHIRFLSFVFSTSNHVSSLKSSGLVVASGGDCCLRGLTMLLSSHDEINCPSLLS